MLRVGGAELVLDEMSCVKVSLLFEPSGNDFSAFDTSNCHSSNIPDGMLERVTSSEEPVWVNDAEE